MDRKKDLVISGGENVYPVEVEEVIRRHQKVHDVAVIGTPDDRLGEIVTAVIQPRSGEVLDEEEIKRFCEAAVAALQTPAPNHLRRCAPESGREDRKAKAQRALPVTVY